MMVTHKYVLACLLGVALLAGCERNTTPDLLNVTSSKPGPDEFAIVPNKPLSQPQNYNDLPAPTSQGTNRADATPMQDAIIALGGNPNARSNDAGLIGYTSRYGVDPSIRDALATEDLAFRRSNNSRLLERAFKVNVYYKIYKKQSLDQYAELERLRRLGIRTPSAPPKPE